MDPEQNIANNITTDAVKGIETLHALALGSLLDAQDALERFEYRDALTALNNADSHVTGLSFIETQVLTIGRGQVISVAQLEKGHRIKDMGTVEETERVSRPCEMGGRHRHDILEVTFEGGAVVKLNPDSRIVVLGADHPA